MRRLNPTGPRRYHGSCRSSGLVSSGLVPGLVSSDIAAEASVRPVCHTDDSRPPAPPVRTGVAGTADLTLTSTDGTRVLAHEAVPAQPGGAGIVIMPDVRGLHPYYKALAEAFADAGIRAVAIDYFGRTAPDDDRAEGFEFMPHVKATRPETISQDVAAGIAHLTSTGQAPRAVFTVGFCFGGSASWAQSGAGLGLAGCIGFYGGSPLQRSGFAIPTMTAPLLMLLAGVDSTSPEEFAEFAERARGAGVEVESHTYDGAPHSFFDRAFADHREACEDAWRQMLGFVGRLSS